MFLNHSIRVRARAPLNGNACRIMDNQMRVHSERSAWCVLRAGSAFSCATQSIKCMRAHIPCLMTSENVTRRGVGVGGKMCVRKNPNAVAGVIDRRQNRLKQSPSPRPPLESSARSSRRTHRMPLDAHTRDVRG